MTRCFFKILTLTLLLGWAALANAGPPRPLLWQVSDGDNRIYLLGAFHLLTEADYPLAPAVEAAFDDAESLVFELAPHEMDSPALGQRMVQLALRTDGTTLQSSLSPAMWKKLEAYAQQRNLPLAQWQRFHPWFVALVINMAEMQRLGLNPALGLDRHFVGRAKQAGKPGRGLETGESQLLLFAGMSPAEQMQSLEETLEKLDSIDKETRELHDLWRAGNDKALYKEMALELAEEFPALYKRLQHDRNAAWLPQLQALLDEHSDDDALVVVGAMHLLGPDGLLAMLSDKGYRIERL